ECSFEAPERQFLEIVGTEASASVDRAYTPGPADTAIALRHRDGRVETVSAAGADPYRVMIEHFHGVVRGSAAPRRAPAASITLLAVLERLRAAAGLAPCSVSPSSPFRPAPWPRSAARRPAG